MPFRRPKLWRSRKPGEPLAGAAVLGAAAGGACAAFGLDWRKTLGVVTAAYVVMKVLAAEER